MTACVPESILDRVERRLAESVLRRRAKLIEALARSASGRPWSFVLFGSMARGDVHRSSDADICIRLAPAAAPADAVQAWREARSVCARLGLVPDVHVFEELPSAVQRAVIREGIACAL